MLHKKKTNPGVEGLRVVILRVEAVHAENPSEQLFLRPSMAFVINVCATHVPPVCHVRTTVRPRRQLRRFIK